MQRTARLIALLLPVALLVTAHAGELARAATQDRVPEMISSTSDTRRISVDQASGSDDPLDDAPFRTIGAAVRRAERLTRDGTAVSISVAPGTYRESVELFADDPVGALTIEGAGPGVVVSGAEKVARWETFDDGTIAIPWSHDWGLQSWPRGWSDVASERGFSDLLRRRELVIVDGNALRPVASREDLSTSPGTFLVEQGADRILAHPSDGRPNQVEVAVRERTLAIVGRAGVTIRNLTFVHAASTMQSGSVRIDRAPSTLFEDDVFADNVWGGLELLSSSNVVVRRSVASGNGVAGFTGWHNTGVLLEDTLNTGNNVRGAAAGLTSWDGVAKFFANRDVTLRRHESSHNAGHGLWFDTDSSGIVLDHVRLEDNDGSGLFLEAIQGPVRIDGSSICRNDGGGVLDGKADAVTLTASTLADNGRAQIVFTGDPGGRAFTSFDEGERHVVRSRDWRLADNRLVARQDQHLIATTLPSADWDIIVDSLTGTSNRYQTDAASPFRLPGGNEVDLSGWIEKVNDQGATLAHRDESDACATVAAGPRGPLPAYPPLDGGEIDRADLVDVSESALLVVRSCSTATPADGRERRAWNGQELISCSPPQP